MSKTYTYKQRLSTSQIKIYRFIANGFVFFGILLIIFPFLPVLKDELWYRIRQFKQQKYILNSSNNAPTESVFASLISDHPIQIQPVNKKFSIVIEKIGVNAPIKADVPITDSNAYIESLKEGVAHASSSLYPSTQPGNVYLFAHASVNFWQLGKYATVFNLLRKLEPGDKIHVFYNNQDYVYETIGKEVLKGWNTYPITRPVLEPILTLQTCDPPGTTINRLIVTAKLISPKESI